MSATRLGMASVAALLQTACAHGGPVRPEPVSVAAAIRFTVEGGVAGIQERLEVATDGSLRLFVRDVESGEGRLAPAALERLQAVVNGSGFRELLPRYAPADVCCDRFQYTVQVDRTEGEQTVTAVDGVTWPAPLAEAIRLLREAREQVRASP